MCTEERTLIEACLDDLDLQLGELARLHARALLQLAGRPTDTATRDTIERIDAECRALDARRRQLQSRLEVLPHEPPMRLPPLSSFQPGSAP